MAYMQYKNEKSIYPPGYNLRKYIEIDPETGDILYKNNKKKANFLSKQGNIQFIIYFKKCYIAKKIVWIYYNDRDIEGFIEEIDGDPCNIRIENLRIKPAVVKEQPVEDIPKEIPEDLRIEMMNKDIESMFLINDDDLPWYD